MKIIITRNIFHHHQYPISLCSRGRGSRAWIENDIKKTNRQTDRILSGKGHSVPTYTLPFKAEGSQPQVLASTSKLSQWMDLSNELSIWTGLPAQTCTLIHSCLLVYAKYFVSSVSYLHFLTESFTVLYSLSLALPVSLPIIYSPLLFLVLAHKHVQQSLRYLLFHSLVILCTELFKIHTIT